MSLMFENLDVYRRAVDLAEGNGRFTKADRCNFFTIARGSVQEWVPRLERACRQGLIPQVDHDALRDELGGISRMISGLIKGLDKRAL